MQYKNKKNLYKIVFITILLGFIISLAGCNWLSFGLLNIFDPQAQIRLSYTDIDLTEGTIDLDIYSLNEVEFVGTGFEYEYYVGTTKITSLTKMVGATFYVAPSTSPGTPGEITTITGLPLYFQEVQDYMTSNPLVTEMTCTISLIGIDGAGHSISKSVTVDLPAIQPGIDFEPPVANIATTPETPEGDPPLLVIFDASGSTDNRGIASYSWDFGDGSTSSEVVVSHTFEDAGTFIVILTVTDYFGNSDIDTKIITIGIGEVGAKIATTPSPAIGFVPFTVGFDASGSTVASPPVVSYEWDLDGDGDFDDATGVTTVYTYDPSGTYLVQLKVTDSAANEYIAFVTVTANDNP